MNILGEGSSGVGGTSNGGGGGGSGGTAGGSGFINACGWQSGGSGGQYGGGAGSGNNVINSTPSIGAQGAVRIIWPGCARSFPSTRTANE